MGLRFKDKTKHFKTQDLLKINGHTVWLLNTVFVVVSTYTQLQLVMMKRTVNKRMDKKLVK